VWGENIHMIKLASLAFMSLYLSLATVTKAQAATFTFTKIADNTTNFSNFGLPVLNNSGSVAFRGVLKTGVFSQSPCLIPSARYRNLEILITAWKRLVL
jgi:hypothetical protein